MKTTIQNGLSITQALHIYRHEKGGPTVLEATELGLGATGFIQTLGMQPGLERKPPPEK